MKPHATPGSHVKPLGERVARYPEVAYSRLHRDLLRAVDAGAVRFATAEKFHTVLGFRAHDSVETALARLLFVGYTEFGDEAGGGLATLVTPLGAGVLRRWNREQGPVERTGGAE